MASVEGLRIPASSGRRLWPAQAASQRLVRRLPPYAEPPWGRRRPGSGGRQGARSALRPRAPTIGELLGQRAKRMGPSMGTGGDLRAGAPRVPAGIDYRACSCTRSPRAGGYWILELQERIERGREIGVPIFRAQHFFLSKAAGARTLSVSGEGLQHTLSTPWGATTIARTQRRLHQDSESLNSAPPPSEPPPPTRPLPGRTARPS